jgi:hypothetical protein
VAAIAIREDSAGTALAMDDGLGVSGTLQVKELLREVHVDLPHPAGHALPQFLHMLRQRLVQLPPTTVRT